MSDRWMTLAAAAATLNVHPRTIERRIASGKIQCRRTDDGQLQVLVTNAPDESAAMNDPLETVRELANDQVTLATGSASAIVRLAQADAERARGELELVRQEAGRTRQGARMAWTTVGLMAAAICAAVGWTTHRITQSREEISSMRRTAERVEREAQQLLSGREQARRDAEQARIEAAQSAGRLAAYMEQAAVASRTTGDRPTTRPNSLIHRLADAISGN